VGDIEKLIKRKIDLEPFVIEDDRPRRRHRDDDEERAPRRTAPRSEFAEDGSRPAFVPSAPPVRAPRQAPKDPFFDQPYEADPNASPVWEKQAAVPAAPGSRSSISRFIKPRRKVAALLGGKVPT